MLVICGTSGRRGGSGTVLNRPACLEDLRDTQKYAIIIIIISRLHFVF